MKVLLLTVGGSCAPILTSIQENRPDKTYFLCSDDDPRSGNKGSYISVIGERKDVCGGDKPSIVKQLSLQESDFEIMKLTQFDDHNYCYKECADLIQSIKRDVPSASIYIDYSGGTKSMTAGLVLAASDFSDIFTSLVKGDRTNLVKVDDGTQRVRLSRVNYSFLGKQKQTIEQFIQEYNYGSAITVLDEIFKTTFDLPVEYDRDFQYLFSVSKAFDAWDKFEHQTALNLLEIYRKDFWPYINFLQRVISSMEQLDTSNEIKEEKVSGSGYEVVEDLLLNAERRATQRRYDDAVGRIYRATELFAQIFLFRNYGVVTGNVDLDKIPPEIAELLVLKSKGSSKKSIQLGLVDSYNLIAELDDVHQIGPLYKEQEKKLWSALEIRNSSILAHGVRPVHSAQYQSVHEALVTKFLAPALKIIGVNKKLHDVKQFPSFFGPRKNS